MEVVIPQCNILQVWCKRKERRERQRERARERSLMILLIAFWMPSLMVRIRTSIIGVEKERQ